ncbi:MAG TPA: cell division protein FtsQ [Opitutaceae bacterium]|jgi:hypothetical protein|nr:cell division protein FtsQ [Opitutaceae bacterium]
MSKTATISRPARTWQDISQSVNQRAMSKTGRRRRQAVMLKAGGIVLVLAAVVWGAMEISSVIDSNQLRENAAKSEMSVRDVALSTDGVLDQAWTVRTLALAKNADLMALDLYALRARLLASGQVSAAVLTRNFPTTLGVSLQERAPVARVMAQIGDTPPHALLVARDGVVYDGEGYAPALLSTLPWLDGVKLMRAGRGFAPVDGMETVADLLATAHNQAEHLYRTFTVVSLARLASDGEIVVHSKDIPEITFSTRDDFFRQLARLDYVLDLARMQPDKALKSVNLANGLQVPVALDTRARSENAGDPSARVTPLVPNNAPSLFPNLKHLIQRDF